MDKPSYFLGQARFLCALLSVVPLAVACTGADEPVGEVRRLNQPLVANLFPKMPAQQGVLVYYLLGKDPDEIATARALQGW
jgi:hypothetical protein